MTGWERGYLFLARATGLLWRAVFCWRLLRGKEDSARIGERWAKASCKRPDGEIIWVHGASIGEARSALGLVDFLADRMPYTTFLVTTQTRSSALVLEKELQAGRRFIHQMFPGDAPVFMERFLAYWRPSAVLFLESDLWPCAILCAAKRGIALFWLNGRMSEKSCERWGIVGAFLRGLLGRFEKCLLTREAWERLMPYVPLKRSITIPSLKYFGRSPVIAIEALKALEEALSGRHFFLASCIHHEEEDILIHAILRVKERFPRMCVVWAPRYPKEALQLHERLQEKGLFCSVKSRDAVPGLQTDVFIVDTFGELDVYYALSTFAVMGGSFGAVGGHSILEAVQGECAVIHGPDIRTNGDVTEHFIAQGACRKVEGTSEGLAEAIEDLLGNPDKARALAERAMVCFRKNADELLAHIMGLKNSLEEAAYRHQRQCPFQSQRENSQDVKVGPGAGPDPSTDPAPPPAPDHESEQEEP